MQITWDVGGTTELRLLPHEWKWLKAALSKVKREPFPTPADQFVADLATAEQLVVKTEPAAPEEKFL